MKEVTYEDWQKNPARVGKMTKYEELMNKSDECCLKAIDYAKKGDWNMATFYKNASIGFKEKALKLNVGC